MSHEVVTITDPDDVPTWRRWLPWVVLAAVIIIVALLIWLYSDWRTPRDTTATDVPAATVKVPDVVGLDADDATAVLVAAGFKVEEDVSYDIYFEPGTVSSQAPAAGSRVNTGAIVIIDVVTISGEAADADIEEPDYQGEARGLTARSPKSVRMVTAPDIVGLSKAEAIAAVEAAGLEPRPLYQPQVYRQGEVIEQRPAAGASTPAGSLMHFLIYVAP